MRLIDADGLMETVKALENMGGEYADSFTNMAGNRAIELSRLEDYIENAPTVKRKNGMWMGTVCSTCGESTSFYFDCKYCPHCGAEMDGEKGKDHE